jgi:hypothetical protein
MTRFLRRSHARNGKRWSARSHVLMLIVLFLSLSFSFLVSLASPRVRQQNDLQARNTRRPTRPNHSPFRSHCLVLSFLHLVSLSCQWTTLADTYCRHYHAAAVRASSPPLWFLDDTYTLTAPILDTFYICTHQCSTAAVDTGGGQTLIRDASDQLK